MFFHQHQCKENRDLFVWAHVSLLLGNQRDRRKMKKIPYTPSPRGAALKLKKIKMLSKHTFLPLFIRYTVCLVVTALLCLTMQLKDKWRYSDKHMFWLRSTCSFHIFYIQTDDCFETDNKHSCSACSFQTKSTHTKSSSQQLWFIIFNKWVCL